MLKCLCIATGVFCLAVALPLAAQDLPPVGAADTDRASAAADEDPRFAAPKMEDPSVSDQDLRFASPTILEVDSLHLSSPGTSDDAAAVKLKWSGAITSEGHYRTVKMVTGEYSARKVLKPGWSRNENSLNLKLTATAGTFSGIADIDFDWLGFSTTSRELSSLTYPEEVSPYRLQAHGLYFDAVDILVAGLDLRLGQQVVAWGVGDQFNPTNTINPSDLENVLFFGRQVANLMAKVDYALSDNFGLSGVLVPVFKPSLLPATAPLGMAAADRLPFVSDKQRYILHTEREMMRMMRDNSFPTVVTAVNPVLPEPTAANMQWALRLAGVLWSQDVAVSYYAGRTTFPVATKNVIHQNREPQCNPDVPSECVQGLLETDVTVSYPKVQVVGLNLAGEVNPLGFIGSAFKPIGYRLELGVYFPSEQRFNIIQDKIEIFGEMRDGEYQYLAADGKRPLVVSKTPFAKWVVGLDHTFGRHVMLNLMWVHGLPDEYGAGDFFNEGWSVRQGGVNGEPSSCFFARDGTVCATETLRPRLGDYAVFGVDLNFADSRGLLRIFALWDLNGVYFEAWDPRQKKRVREYSGPTSGEGFSAVLYPELRYNFGYGLTLATGAFWQFGESYTKFGDPAAGGSMLWGRASLAF